MKKIFTIFLCLLSFYGKAQTANAGADQTIYLTSTSTATLDGSASAGTSYQWTEVSTDYSSGATITSPTSATTTVTGLTQGTWYFELTVDGTAKDTTIVNVQLSQHLPGTFLHGLQFSNSTFYNYINNRSDTTQLTSSPASLSAGGDDYVLDRCRSNSMFVDNIHGKFQTIVEDGYGWQSNTSYARSELSYGTGGMPIDTSTTYEINWQGYFPQDFSNLAMDQTVASIIQVHGLDGNSPPFGFSMLYGLDGGNTHAGTAGYKGFYFTDQYVPGNTVNNDSVFHLLCPLDSFYKKTHTIRILLKEGSGTGSFIKVYFDGALKYKRENDGKIGATLEQDYLKFATIYDYGNALVDPTNTTRGRVFKLVTNSFNVYSNTDTTISGGGTSAPTISMSGNQTISTSSATISATASWASGQTAGSPAYTWTQTSGTTATIVSPNSSSTTVSGVYGSCTFQCVAKQSDGQTATGTVNVNDTTAAPTIYAGNNDTTTLVVDTLTATYTVAPGKTATFNWVQNSGPNSATITSPTSASTQISGLVSGDYNFTCTITDIDGRTASDYVWVHVTLSSGITNFKIYYKGVKHVRINIP